MQIRQLAKWLILAGVVTSVPLVWGASLSVGASGTADVSGKLSGSGGSADLSGSTDVSGKVTASGSAGSSSGSTSGSASGSAGVTGTASSSSAPGAGSGQYQMTDDVMLTSKIKAAFLADKSLAARSIHVSVKQRVALLTGIVASEGERKHADEVASSVEGVASVKNELKVKS